jgi:hypothetical protein
MARAIAAARHLGPDYPGHLGLTPLSDRTLPSRHRHSRFHPDPHHYRQHH